VELWNRAGRIPGVKHIFIGSGVRYDLLADASSDDYLKALCARHISGRLKVAPEHSEDSVLRQMNKPSIAVYERFARRFRGTNKSLHNKHYLVHYFLISHPGCTLEDALNLALWLKKKHIHPEQVQDFIPLPMTLSTCLYYTGKNPLTGEAVYVPRGLRERKMQRALVQYGQPKNRKYVVEALKKLNRLDAMSILFRRD
jgi:uncharacterized radical SAM protein YgiQ